MTVSVGVAEETWGRGSTAGTGSRNMDESPTPFQAGPKLIPWVYCPHPAFPHSHGQGVNKSQKNTAQGQIPRWPTKSGKRGKNHSVLHLFPSKHCKINTSPHVIRVSLCVCFLNNVLQIALCAHVVWGCHGKWWGLGVKTQGKSVAKAPLALVVAMLHCTFTSETVSTGLCFFGTICCF